MASSLVEHYIEEYMEGKQSLSKMLFKENSPLFNEDYLTKFINTGRDLYNRGLVTSNGGNISVTDGDFVWITRKGASLGELMPEDVVMISWNPDAEDLREASSEANIHHAICAGAMERVERKGIQFEHMAVIHAMPPNALFRSYVDDEILSVDGESREVLGASTPVIKIEGSHNSEELERIFNHMVTGEKMIVAVRDHGVFAAGRKLADAQRLIVSLEQTATLLNLFEMTGRAFKNGPADGQGA